MRHVFYFCRMSWRQFKCVFGLYLQCHTVTRWLKEVQKVKNSMATVLLTGSLSDGNHYHLFSLHCWNGWPTGMRIFVLKSGFAFGKPGFLLLIFTLPTRKPITWGERWLENDGRIRIISVGLVWHLTSCLLPCISVPSPPLPLLPASLTNHGATLCYEKDLYEVSSEWTLFLLVVD